MPHTLLIYETAPDYLERRGQFRDAHLAKAWAATERGEIVMAGALAPPESMALIVFQGENAEAAAKAFAETDPYVVNGIVARWRTAEWRTVVGSAAADPVRPGG